MVFSRQTSEKTLIFILELNIIHWCNDTNEPRLYWYISFPNKLYPINIIDILQLTKIYNPCGNEIDPEVDMKMIHNFNL